MKAKKHKIFIIMAYLIGLIVATLIIWHLYLAGAFLPKWIKWQEEELVYSEDVTVSLKDKELRTVDKEGKLRWELNKDWLVQDCLKADITGDGENELIVLFFRRGRFGRSMPFFIKKNEKNWTQHIGVYSYDLDNKEFASIWVASDIGIDAKNWKYDELHRRLLIEDKEGQVSSWTWPGFGLVRADDSVSFAVCGDNLIHESIYKYGLEKENGDFSYLYKDISDRLKEYDLRAVNLETMLVDKPDLYSGFPAFGSPVQIGEALRDAGFQIFACANNHSLDKGMTGIDTTVSFCDGNDIDYLGIQASDEDENIPYKIIWKKGYSFAMFNYTMGLSNTNGKYPEGIKENAVWLMDDEDEIRKWLKDAREKADGLIVFVHWGREDTATLDEFQIKWAKIFNECGVDVVIGSHPHVLQETDVLVNNDGHKTLIYYSLGNLISASRHEANRIGGIAEFELRLTMNGMELGDYELEKVQTIRDGARYSVELYNEKVPQ